MKMTEESISKLDDRSQTKFHNLRTKRKQTWKKMYRASDTCEMISEGLTFISLTLSQEDEIEIGTKICLARKMVEI